jgi:hypothetical protein
MLCALLSLLLPRTTVSDSALIGSDDASRERESIRYDSQVSPARRAVAEGSLDGIGG